MQVEEEVAAYSSGHVSIPRERILYLLKHLKPNHFELAMYLICKANWKENQWWDGTKMVTICRGQLITSHETITYETKLSRQNIRTALLRLSQLGFLHFAKSNQQPNQRYTFLTISEYESYVNGTEKSNQQINQHLTSTQPAPNQRLTTTEEGKELKERKEYSSKDPTLFSEEFIPPKETTNGKIRVRHFTEDLKIDPYCLQFAAKNGLNGRVEILWSQMIDWHMKEGKGTMDLHASWRTFVRNELSYKKGRNSDPPPDCPECEGLTRFDKTTRERIKCKTCGKQ